MLVYQRVFSIDGLHWEDFLPGQSVALRLSEWARWSLKVCTIWKDAKKIGKYMIQVQSSWFSTFLFPFQNPKKGLILTGRAWLSTRNFPIQWEAKELMIWVSFRQDFSKSHSAIAIFLWGFFGAQECSACQNLLESKIKARAGVRFTRAVRPQFFLIVWIKLRTSPWIRKMTIVEKPKTRFGESLMIETIKLPSN